MKKIIIALLMLTTLTMGTKIDDVLSRLSNKGVVEIIDDAPFDGYEYAHVKWHDKSIPLTLHFLGDNNASKVFYMIASVNGGFEFFTNKNQTLASMAVDSGYLVVAITPRSDNVPYDSLIKVKKWGLKKHRRDVKRVVRRVQRELKFRFDMLGFSNGALVATDFAASYCSNRMDKLIILGFDSYERSDTGKIDTNTQIYNAAKELINDSAIYADTSAGDFIGLIQGALYYPNLNSGVPRGDGTNFTLGALAVTALIYSDLAPGIHTPITGIVGTPFLPSNLSGYYTYDPDPLLDGYGFDNLSISTLNEGTQKINYGTSPVALLRDFSSTAAYLGSGYQLELDEIDVPVNYINASKGYNDYTGWETEIDSVTVDIVYGYGHIDLLVSDSSFTDVYPLIFK